MLLNFSEILCNRAWYWQGHSSKYIYYVPYLVPNLDQTVDSYGDFDGGDKGLVSHHSLLQRALLGLE